MHSEVGLELPEHVSSLANLRNNETSFEFQFNIERWSELTTHKLPSPVMVKWTRA